MGRNGEEEVANSLLLGAEKDYVMTQAEAGFMEPAAMKEHSLGVQEDLQRPTTESAICISE